MLAGYCILCGSISPVPGSQIAGKTWKWKAREKLAGREKGKVSSRCYYYYYYFFHVRAFSIQRTQLSPSLEQARFNSIRISPVVTGYDLIRPYTGQFVSQFCGHTSCKPSNSPWNEASSQVATVSYSKCCTKKNQVLFLATLRHLLFGFWRIIHWMIVSSSKDVFERRS